MDFDSVGWLYRCAGSIIAAVLLALVPIAVQASVNIPLDSPFYDDLDTLIAKGLIQSDLSSTRPITRQQAGSLLAEARYRSEKKKIPGSAKELLDRLSAEYADEISEADGSGARANSVFKPVDEFSVAYRYLDGPFSIFNNEGIDYFNGNNAAGRLQSRARLWEVFTFYIEPLLLYHENYRGIEGDHDSTVRVHKGYMKFTIDNFEIEAGRDSLWWGPGYHGALLISNNTRPFDMIKVSNPQAAILPWIFRYVGPFKYTLFLSELDSKPESGHPPDSNLFGARIDFKPHPLFEFGLSYLAHFGGDRPGIEGLDASDYFYIVFSNECREFDKRDSNKQASIDAALTIPNVSDLIPLTDSLKLYAEWGGEDQALFPTRRAYLAGILFHNIFTAHGFSLRAEYAHISPQSVPEAWYRHPVWAMMHYGNVIGHHAGTDSDDLYFELSYQAGEDWRFRAAFDRERSGLSKPYSREKQQYFLEVDCRCTERLHGALTCGHEKITHLDYTEGSEQKNQFIGAELRVMF